MRTDYHRVTCLTAFKMFVFCLLASFTAHAQSGNVILWNKLGSDTEIISSEIGPGGQKTAGYFTPGPFANFGQAFLNNLERTDALTFPADLVVPTSKGTIEFWAKLNNFPNALFDGVAFLNPIQPNNILRLGFGSNNGCGGGGLYGTFGVATDGYCSGYVDTATQPFYSYAQTLGSILGDRTVWHHYAMVWNEAGISQLGGRKLYLYLDGKLVSTSYYQDRSPWGSIPPGSRFGLGYFFNITGVSVAVDNLIVWDDVKTDFSDRFIESPLGCDEGGLPDLAAGITKKSGTQNARIWTVSLSNKSGCPAENAQVDAFALTQTTGSACTPLITSPLSFPLGVGNIAANTQASGTVTLDFTGCPNNARFKATIPFSSNNGAVTGSKTLNNQFR